MKVKLLSFDSFATRSMATYIKTDVKILIDPSAALGPRRYGLPPHPIEIKQLEKDLERIRKYSKKCDIIVITHYHYDHHKPSMPEVYEDKVLLIKDYRSNINRSQRIRARVFLSSIKPREVIVADGKELFFKETRIKFSNPVFHGQNSKLGYVIEVLVEYKGFKLLFTSDVEGPCNEEQAKFILDNKPNIAIIDGPMTYMLGYRYSYENLERAKRYLENITACVETVVVDHHLLRDIRWRERIENDKVITAAEFMGKENVMLEARRKELYETEPVD
jgi:predicted metallo-beta-lactamase superfamily hydrolase